MQGGPINGYQIQTILSKTCKIISNFYIHL
jgi:hypothetical protein